MSNETIAAVEPAALLQQLQQRLEKPVTVAELLNPELVLAGIDFAVLDRADAAIKQLRRDGIKTVRSPRWHDELISLGDAALTLAEARTLAQQLKLVRAAK